MFHRLYISCDKCMDSLAVPLTHKNHFCEWCLHYLSLCLTTTKNMETQPTYIRTSPYIFLLNYSIMIPFFLLKNKTLSQAMSHHIMLLNINLFLKVFWDPRTYISIFVFVSWCIFLLLILFNYLEFGNTIKETQFIYLDA
jgi:hypothetical protein